MSPCMPHMGRRAKSEIANNIIPAEGLHLYIPNLLICLQSCLEIGWVGGLVGVFIN